MLECPSFLPDPSGNPNFRIRDRPQWAFREYSMNSSKLSAMCSEYARRCQI